MKKIFILLFIMQIISFSTHLRAQEWVIYDDLNSGLGDKDTRCLAIDQDGIKWIGTVNDAVFTFDGTAWNHYNDGNAYIYDDYILCITVDSRNYKWIGTRSGGMAMFDGSLWYLYDEDHSDIPDNKVYDIQFEGNMAWIATMHGLAKFDGTSWEIFNTGNSGLPAEEIRGIAIDGQGNKWLATWGGGVAKFDGSNWTVYDESNSLLPTDMCISIFFDGSSFWVGTSLGGLAKFDGINWEVFTAENSGLPQNTVFSSKKEDQKLWFASAGGVASLQGTVWTVFNPENSPLPSPYTKDLEIDGSGNKWIATDSGLAVYRQGGVIGVKEQINAASANEILQIYPNPVSQMAVVSWRFPVGSQQSAVGSHLELEIYDLVGNKILNLAKSDMDHGLNSVTLDAGSFPPGVYFCRLKTKSYPVSKKFIKL